MEVLLGIVALFLGLYYFLKRYFAYDFWQRHDIPGPQPVPIYGNLKEIIFGKMSVGELVKQEYDRHKQHPMFGIYAMHSPILVINDPELIKDVLVKNFSSFANRGVRIFEKVEPLSANLINLEVTRWKPLRAKQTTMFTSAKLKEMFYLLLECADNLEKKLVDGEVVEVCELTAKYTIDCIGSCIFGIDMKALEDENSDFRRIGKKFIHLDKWRAFKVRFKQICPWLFELLGPIMYDHEINDFFIGTMIQTMEYRKKSKMRRGDFVDLLNDLKDNPGKLDGIELTNELLTAQAFAFFFAGFDTSSLTISHALYELALNQSMQDGVRDEILSELSTNDDEKIKYENIENMKYLRKVFCETLRKYPVTPILTRQSIEPYTFSNGQLTIPKGMRVWIPVYGIHRDPDVYPNPDVFDPERHSEDNVRQRHPSYYLPFGTGPRNCLGVRFGNYQSKIALITILKNYKVQICDKTPIRYVTNKRRFLIGPAAGIHLRLTKIN